MTNPEERTPVITIRSPEETIAPFLIALQATILRVELGLSASLPKEETKLPNTILKISPAQNHKPTMEERHQDFEYWLLSNGLREFAEAFHLFLDDIHITCRWYDLASIAPVTDEHISKLVLEPHQQFHPLSFPDKIKLLRKLFQIQIREDALERIRSLNKVRNCLAHRRGVIRADDVNAGQDTLLVKWLGLRFEIKGKRYTLAEKEKTRFASGDKMDVIFCPVERRFRVGEQLNFNQDEFAEFGVTYMILAKELVPQLEAMAERCVKLRITKSDTST